MVLKKSKFGGNTGNTLRKSNMGGYKICKTAGFISKQSEDTEIQSLRDDMPLPKEWLKNSIHSKKSTNSLNSSRNIKFSLNKNQKWLLPDQIKNEILGESQREIAVNSKSKKCRKQKIHQHHAHVAIIEKASAWGQSRGYTADNSFMNSVDECSNRKSKSWKGPINIPAGVEDLMDITYTVETSIDSKSWPYHTTGHKPYWKSKVKNKCLDKFHGFEDEMYFDDYTYNDIDGEENDELYVESYSPQAIGLDMYIKSNKPEKKQNHCDTSIDLTISTHFEKGSYIIIDRPEDLSEVEQIIESKIEETSGQTEEVFVSNDTFKEANCKVKTKEISSECLTKRFGRSYVEGSCMPRQFIIFNKDFSSNGLIVCVRILTEDLQLSSINLKIMNVSYDFRLCIEELFQHDIFDFEFFIDSCFPMDNVINISNSVKQMSSDETSIEKDFKPTADVIAINDVCRGLFSTKHFNNSDYKNPSPVVCPICYSIGRITCMKECQHYACDDCWRMYLNTKISSGYYNNCLCPETSCKQEVDPVTIITFLDYTLAKRYMQKYCELHVQKNPHLKFCPSANCSKVAVCQPASYSSGKLVKSVIANIPSVNCNCLFKWCFECQRYDHWPASCLANQSYVLQRDDDYNIFYDKNGNINETEVNYRACPKCRNPINKNGGCPHMSCVCGFQFCWDCLRPYLNHDSLQCSYINADISVTFSSLDLLSGGSKKIHMQRKAIQFGLHLKRVFNLKQKLKLVKLTCKFESVDRRSNSPVFTASKAITLLVTCYRLLENLTAANALCRSKHTRARILRFVNSVGFLVELLHTSVNVRNLEKMKVGDVVKKIELLEASLKNISLLGIEKKSLKC